MSSTKNPTATTNKPPSNKKSNPLKKETFTTESPGNLGFFSEMIALSQIIAPKEKANTAEFDEFKNVNFEKTMIEDIAARKAAGKADIIQKELDEFANNSDELLCHEYYCRS